MGRNFYVVLGVSRDADSAQIREAHRRLVRLHHPDTGSGSVERFTEIQEAYETLVDEEAKRSYDQSLPPERRSSRSGVRPSRARVARAPGKGQRSRYSQGAESLLQDEPRPVSIQDAAPGLFGSIDEFLDGWLPGFFTSGRTASRRKDLFVEIILEPEEAARGGLFPLDVPVRERCRACGSTGYVGFFVCHNCRGSGMSFGHREVDISMPAGVADGTLACLSLEDIGLKGVDLNILVSIRSRTFRN